MNGLRVISEMMWHEQHCIHRQVDGHCGLDGEICPWRHPVKTLSDLHDWYPCFEAEGRGSRPAKYDQAVMK